mgnify:CR=1 FL=1
MAARKLLGATNCSFNVRFWGGKRTFRESPLAINQEELWILRTALALSLLLLGCAKTPVEQNPDEKITEAAFLAAVAVGASPEPCRDTIGKESALALVRYCRWNSSATRPPCNTANHCAIIVRQPLIIAKGAVDIIESILKHEKQASLDWSSRQDFPKSIGKFYDVTRATDRQRQPCTLYFALL